MLITIMLIVKMMMRVLIMMLDSCSVAVQYAGGGGLDDMRAPRHKKTLFHLFVKNSNVEMLKC